MKYRNIKTGATIDVKAEVKGTDWKALEGVKKSPSNLKKKVGEKDETVRNTGRRN